MSDTENIVDSALEQALAALPAKPRVHELAKRTGLSSKEIIAALVERGVVVKAASSSVDHAVAVEVLTQLLTGDTPGTPAPGTSTPAVPDDSGSDATPFGGVPLFLAPEPEAAPPRKRASRARTKPAEPADVPDPSTTEADPATPSDATAEPTFDDGAEPTPTRSRSRSRRGRGRSQAADDEATDQPASTEGSVTAGDDSTATQPEQDASADEEHGDTADGGRRRRRRGRRGRGRADSDTDGDTTDSDSTDGDSTDGDSTDGDTTDGDSTDSDTTRIDGTAADRTDAGSGDLEADAESAPRPRRRRRSSKASAGEDAASSDDGSDGTSADGTTSDGTDEAGSDDDDSAAGSGRRRRRRRRGGSGDGESGRGDDPDNTVVHVREARDVAAEVQGIRGSTRLEAKRQRRRDSRESRQRPQILTEAEFLARREAVSRVMVVRERGDLAQVALLEDDVLVEHFVSRAGAASMIGNIYLGRVQNVLPSMEAAFVDIGRGRNAVLYAGEVNWDMTGLVGKARRIETALSSGDVVLAQVSKDPIGHKGARLTTQISLPGRFLVYVPGGGATGISRKLPDTERKRLKQILDRIVPDGAGVIIRTAAEGVSEDDLAADVERLKSQWETIQEAAEAAKSNQSSSPSQLSAEPDTLTKVVRDLFNSDITSLVIDDEGGSDGAYASVSAYVDQVAPELSERVSRYEGKGDVFSRYRIDEQIAKALERKVHLPSGGSLVIDRTEAMTVVDVNTGKYTGSGGNLEETVTKNNLEAAEEIVRQLRLRDIGGIIVVDFIDMVLESNRELVLRRLTECLGRDRTRHQVAEVTSLGLVQMTRKRMGTGLLEAFSHNCEHCHGRGIVLQDAPIDTGSVSSGVDDGRDSGRSSSSSPRKRRERQRPTEPEETPEPIARIVTLKADPRGPRMTPKPSADAADGDAAGTDSQLSIEVAEAVASVASSPAADDGGVEILANATDASRTSDADAGSAADAAPAPVVEEPPAARPRRRRAVSKSTVTAGTAVVLTIDGSANGGHGSAPEPALVGVAAGAGAAAVDGAAVSKGSVTSEAPVARPRRRAARRPAGPAGGADRPSETPAIDS
ncbi:translation initiation factor IF-2 N-terminal domain-containing protein [Nakamurella sp. A5-74]|uniref:Ribonuclease E n=1 Tax=Nakamurella sp. A5-74 TaxID=3158264 RepID=A0AAU8DTE2_9ACTN